MFGPVFLIVFVAFAGCGGPSFEDHIAQLTGSGDDHVRAKQELLLGKQHSVEPLLSALEDSRHAASHPEIVEVLVDLMTRLDDVEKITLALQHHLLTNPDTRVRSRICVEAGLYKRPELVEAYMVALRDSSSVVRGQALVALRRLKGKLSEAQEDSMIAAAKLVKDDDDIATQLTAAALIAHRTNEFLMEASRLKLKGQIAEAESLYHEALAFAPESERAAAGLGLLYFENGQEKRGLQVLRESRWLVDVPRVAEGPARDRRAFGR